MSVKTETKIYFLQVFGRHFKITENKSQNSVIALMSKNIQGVTNNSASIFPKGTYRRFVLITELSAFKVACREVHCLIQIEHLTLL